MEKQTITIDQQVAEWLEKQPKKVEHRRKHFDALTDKKILAGWPVMDKRVLAKELGMSPCTLRKRHRELTGGK